MRLRLGSMSAGSALQVERRHSNNRKISFTQRRQYPQSRKNACADFAILGAFA